MLNPLHTSNHVEEIHLLRSSHGIVYNRNHQILVVPFCKDILWWHKPLHQHLPGCELRSWWKSYFWAKKMATISKNVWGHPCQVVTVPVITSDRMFSRDLTLEKLQQKGAATLIGSISSCQLNHSSWWLKSCDHQLRLVGNIPLFIYRVLYIPGGDRQISEPSTVVPTRFGRYDRYTAVTGIQSNPSDCHRWLYWDDLHRGTLP